MRFEKSSGLSKRAGSPRKVFLRLAAFAAAALIFACQGISPRVSDVFHDAGVYSREAPGAGIAPAAGITAAAAGLPGKYESPYKTPVMDQKDNPLCWAYSTVDMLNVSAVKQGFAPAGTSFFSAPAFARSIYTGEEYRIVSYPDSWYKYSGDPEQAIAAASMGKGLKKASSCPDVASASKIKGSGIYDVDAFVEEFRSFDIWEDPDAKVRKIKEWVVEFGSVGASVFLGSYDSVRKLASTKAWDYTAVSHSILIVGWDDSKSTDTGTGAFLIKNTWGKGWGDGGYAYISYRADLGRSIYAAKAGLSYGRKVLTHCEIIPMGGISSALDDPISAVNVFRMQESASLDSGVVYTGYPALLTVKVWKASGGADASYFSRKPDAEGSLNGTEPGIYTVPFSAAAAVKAGDTVIAQFIIKTSRNYMVYTEQVSYYPPDWNTTCSSGETYLFSDNALSGKSDNYFGALKGSLADVKPTAAPTAVPTSAPTAAPATQRPSQAPAATPVPSPAPYRTDGPGLNTAASTAGQDTCGPEDTDAAPRPTEEGYFIEIPSWGDHSEEETPPETMSPEEIEAEFRKLADGLKKLLKIVGIILLVILAFIIGTIVLIVYLVKRSREKKHDA